MNDFLRVSGAEVFPAHLRGAVVAIGNFDGVHRGHQTVLSRALEIAREQNRPAVVLTFEPNPRQVFQPDVPLFRLTPAPMKAQLLDLLGFDAVIEQKFDRDFAAIPRDMFEREILAEKLGAGCIVTGYDFHYGKARGGTSQTLVEAGERQGFNVCIVEAFSDEGGEVISSSRIRKLLAQGSVAEAAGLLGYRYTVEAEISHGKKLGRTLGFPTANMALPADVELAHGIYAVRLRRPDGTLFDGVASFGKRPTVDSDGEPLLESFIFDFEGDLYGEVCTVSLFSFLRPELKFDGLDELVVQMKQDEAEARALLAGMRPLSQLDLDLTF
jgi:riboflavin kinase/FMN adenylyltransferase